MHPKTWILKFDSDGDWRYKRYILDKAMDKVVRQILVASQVSVECRVWGYHVQNDWNKNSRYVDCVWKDKTWCSYRGHVCERAENEQTVTNVLKFQLKLTHCYLINSGNLTVTIIWNQRYSQDLRQGGMEVPVNYTQNSTNIIFIRKCSSLKTRIWKNMKTRF